MAPGHLQITQLNGNSLINNSSMLDLGRKLLDACKTGETDEVRSLMESGAPFTTDWLGTSPLHFAAQYGHYETGEVLLRAGVSRDTRTRVDRTPLHFAAQEGHIDLVNLLLGHGAEVNAKDLLKMTPLHWAVEKGHYEVCERLLMGGADVNLLNKFDMSPIDIAIEKGQLELLPLLQKFVNVSVPKTEASSPTSCIKSRPTILPNKANRTQKPGKPIAGINLSEPIILSSTKGKTINIENLKKIISGATTTGNATTATIKANSASDALQWLELNGITTSGAKCTENGETTITSSSESCGKSLNGSKNQIITIVSNNQLPQMIKSNGQSPIVFVSKTESDETGKPMIKFEKISPSCAANITGGRKPTLTTIATGGKSAVQAALKPLTISSISSASAEELEKLRQELKCTKEELMTTKQELEESRSMLAERDQVIEEYKRQVEMFKGSEVQIKQELVEIDQSDFLEEL